MNNLIQAFTQRVTAFALALLMTMGMLSAVDYIATSDASPGQIARIEADDAST